MQRFRGKPVAEKKPNGCAIHYAQEPVSFFLRVGRKPCTSRIGCDPATERTASLETSRVEADATDGEGGGPQLEHGTNPNVGVGERDGISVA